MTYYYHEFIIHDYEHEGDLSSAVSEVRHNFPKANNIMIWEERDGEVINGYISFYAPEEYEERLKNYSF